MSDLRGVLGVGILHQSIEALGQKFADLYVLKKNVEWTEYDSLVLDRTAIALSQDQLRRLYVEQKRRAQENQWILNWLSGDYQEAELETYLAQIASFITTKDYVACICKLTPSHSELDMTYYSMILTKVFEKYGFFSLNLIDQSTITFVLFNQRKPLDWKNRCRLAAKEIQDLQLLKNNQLTLQMAIGRRYQLWEDLKKSYQKAQEVLCFQEKAKRFSILFYEDLALQRLFLKLDREELKDYVEDYIGDLLEHDAKHKETLFDTLKVLLEVNGTKKEAAKHLHVVRQTLYHRVDKLNDLLGDPFLSSEKRLAIEVAINAYLFLKEY